MVMTHVHPKTLGTNYSLIWNSRSLARPAIFSTSSILNFPKSLNFPRYPRMLREQIVSVQFIVIFLIRGICKYPNSIKITIIQDLFDLLSIWEYHFCKIMLTIDSQCHRFVPFDLCTTSSLKPHPSDFRHQTSDFRLPTLALLHQTSPSQSSSHLYHSR